MKTEKKYIVADFEDAEFKAIESGSGGFEGYGNATGVLDDVGDIVLEGAFKDTIPDFLKDGWIALDHEWGIAGDVGIFTDAKEDTKGLYVVAEFHPTDDAQRARQKVLNRVAKGKSVKLSIGYAIVEQQYVSGKEAVQYLKNPTPADIARCESKTRVRLLIKLKLYEVSLVSVPANTSSDVVVGKNKKPADGRPASDQAIDIKGQYLGDYIEGELVFDALYNLVQRLYWGPAWDALYSDEMTVADRSALMAAAIDELRDYTIRFIEAVFAADSTEGKQQLLAELKSHIDLHTANDAASLAEATMIDHSDAALAAVKGFVHRVKHLRSIRKKEGRTISTATRERLTPHATALKEIAADIDDLIAAGDIETSEAEIVGDTSKAAGLAAEALKLEAEFLHTDVQTSVECL